MLPCAWKYYLGLECPGCGFQRAVYALLHGDLLGSLKLFPAAIPILATFLFLALHLWFKYKHGARIITILFSFSAALMIISYIVKISQHGMHA